jgi:hypothetical protein
VQPRINDDSSLKRSRESAHKPSLLALITFLERLSMHSPADLHADSITDAAEKSSLLEIGAIALFALALTAIAYRAYPLWDDGLLLLLSQHGGGQAIRDSIGDRPAMARIVQRLVDFGYLREVTAIFHCITWFGVGWVTLRLWKVLFPAQRQFGLAAACLAIAPVVCQIQTVLLTIIIPCVIGPLVVFLVTLPFLSRRIASKTSRQIRLLWIVMVVAVAAVSMVSEYPLATVAATSVLLIGLAPHDQGQTRRVWITVALLLTTAIATYALYHQLADPAARLEARPEAQPWGYRLKWLGPRMFTDVWGLTLGIFLQRLGGIQIWNTSEAFLGMFAGMLGALLLAWLVRAKEEPVAPEHLSRRGTGRAVASLLGAIAVGIFPLVAMGYGGHSWSSSRSWVPVLPVSAVMTVFLLLLLLRAQVRWLAALVVGFAAGFFLVNDGLVAIHQRDRLVVLGNQLEPQVLATGLTVAIVQYPWRYPLPFPKEWDLTARLTINWPQAKRDHFWAFAGMEQVYLEKVSRDGKSVTVLDDPFGPRPQLLRAWRKLTRQFVDNSADLSLGGVTEQGPPSQTLEKAEPITQILWITEGPDGKIHVERLPTRQDTLKQ